MTVASHQPDRDPRPRLRLGRILVEAGLLRDDQLQEALRLQHASGRLLFEVLVQEGMVTEAQIAAALMERNHLPYIEPSHYTIADDLLGTFDPAMMRRFQFVPVDSIGSVLVIAVAGVLSDDVLRQIASQTGCTVKIFQTRISEIDAVLQAHHL
jgi:type IV pilus assembly protein PilB